MAPEGDGAADAGFEDIFAMMMEHFPAQAHASRAAAEAPAKRPRTDGDAPSSAASGAADPPTAATASSASASSAPLSASRALVPSAAELPDPPPERVIAAYALLDLPLSSSAHDVERRSRRLARRAHPDKVSPDFPELRERAEREFRELQEAKRVALGWLYGVGSRDYEAASSDDGAQLSASEDEDGADDLRAIGIPAEQPDEWAERPGEQEAEEGAVESEGSGSECGAAELGARPRHEERLRLASASGEVVCVGDHVLAQAAVLSAHLKAAEAKPRRLCQECFEREALPDEDACKACAAELASLWRRLQGGPGTGAPE